MGSVTSAFAVWASAVEPCIGESVCGDRCLVEPDRDGMLIAAVDGVGHGHEAARAAVVALESLQRAGEGSPESLLTRCHEALRGTRGAVVIVARYDARERTLAWTGVGDVLGALVRADPRARPRIEVLMPRAGVAGHRLPQTSAGLLAVGGGDTLVLATDGVRDDFIGSVDLTTDPGLLAERILARHRKGRDDALVLVVRFNGAGT